MSSSAKDAHNWTDHPEFGESSFTETVENNVRTHVNVPLEHAEFRPIGSLPLPGLPLIFRFDVERARATRLIVFALPNGNTLEQTLGCQAKPGLDWHYDIQHIAAQVRMLRTLFPDEHIVLVCAEAPGLSWPSFRKTVKNANSRIGELVKSWRDEFGNDKTKVTLAGHSGGGSFMFGVIESADAIPAYIDRIAFLDSNYSFDAEMHAKKIEDWLKADDGHRLIVVCYDDREITLNGKKVVSDTGGTYRATGRMHDALSKVFELADSEHPPFLETTGLNGRIHFYKHPNPENKILHTLLVGEMNGLLQVATLGTSQEGQWGTFGGPRVYDKYVQADPTPTPHVDGSSATASSSPAQASSKTLPTSKQSQLPPRPANAIGGAEFAKKIDSLDLKSREDAIFHEIKEGNFPEFLRNFKVIKIDNTNPGNSQHQDISGTLEVMPDYLAIGSDADFVRMPMTPQTAQRIADKFGCVLPTRKMVDAIDSQAELKIEPHPMTEAREAIATFVEHNRIIESQRSGNALGPLTIGIKKDIVLTPRIFEKPERLAIYGWRQLDGKPIQPLTIVHWNQYVDYSHGVRLVRDTIEVGGKKLKIAEMLADPDRCGLVSDEGPMQPPRYPTE